MEINDTLTDWFKYSKTSDNGTSVKLIDLASSSSFSESVVSVLILSKFVVSEFPFSGFLFSDYEEK